MFLKILCEIVTSLKKSEPGVGPNFCENKTPVQLIILELWSGFVENSPKNCGASIWIWFIFEGYLNLMYNFEVCVQTSKQIKLQYPCLSLKVPCRFPRNEAKQKKPGTCG